ncbi:MAG: DUF2933 domain-containing protein [Alicyclobacillus sp.]|nr:DUF2933 domain-containing protein [Alicyclobacillus sp.]
MQTLGSFIALLACPLMMILMMKGMHGGHGEHGTHRSSHRRFGSREEELADMKRRLDELQTEYDRLSQQQKERSGHLG